MATQTLRAFLDSRTLSPARDTFPLNQGNLFDALNMITRARERFYSLPPEGSLTGTQLTHLYNAADALDALIQALTEGN